MSAFDQICEIAGMVLCTVFCGAVIVRQLIRTYREL